MATHEHHASHGGADHHPAADQLSPNQHRQHAEPDEHGGPRRRATAGHGGHGDHAAQFRDRFWLSLVLTIPVVLYSEMVQEWLGFTPPQFPGSQWVAPVLGTIVFLYGGRPFLEGGAGRAAQPPAGHDAAHLPGHPGRLRGQCRHPVRRVRPGVLVGAGPADRDHAAGPLAGDAGPRPGLQRPGCPGGAAAGRGRAGHRRRDRDGAHRPAGRGRPGPGPPGRPGPGRRPGQRRRGRAGRVDDHRRVPPGPQAGRRQGGRGNGGHRLGPAGPGGRGRGGDRPGRDPPAGRAGPDLPLPGPGPGRPGGRAAVLLRRRRRPPHPGGVDCSWASPTRRSSARSRCW